MTSITAAAVLGVSMLLVFGAKQTEFAAGEKIGVVEIEGPILDSKYIIQDIKRFREDDHIKGIVVRIDSPGGGVGPSQEIYREIRKTISVKHVIASMGAVAASGGYYIAAASDGIVANAGTVTGSIGVIMGFTNFKALLDKIGLTPVIVKSGAFKDTGSPVRDMTDAEKTLLQDLVGNIHSQFVTAVAQGRKMDQSRVEALADGRIFSGEQARKFGLVDRIGNLEDAIEWAGRMGGITGEVSAVYAREPKFKFLKYVMDSTANKILHQMTRMQFYTGYFFLPQEQR